MDIRTLKNFLALADNLHFGRASVDSHISLSALSRNIKQLEGELGVLLFNRDNRSVVLTEQGAKFQLYAREAVSQWDQVRNQLSDNSDLLHGEISLYCSVTAVYSLLFDLLTVFDMTSLALKSSCTPATPNTLFPESSPEMNISASPPTRARCPEGWRLNPLQSHHWYLLGQPNTAI